MSEKFDPEFDAIRAALVSKPELTKNLNVSLRNVLRLTAHLKNSGLRMERHGRWLTAGSNIWWCSACENDWLFHEGTPEENEAYFCPHCGAKMEIGDWV